MQRLVDEGAGILITPNHSFHYDSYVLFEAAHRLKRPFYFMTAWQVFAMSSRVERFWLQRHGCFSIDRENNDLQAIRQAVQILKNSSYPLVIFPEGEIYHTNDRVTPFREGAAAIALSAARKSDRPVVCVPCALKCWYISDPTPELNGLMDQLEERLFWRPRSDLSLPERVYRLAEGLIVLKELELLGKPQEGTIVERRAKLADHVIGQQEQRYGLKPKGTIPERVTELRRTLIRVSESPSTDLAKREQAHSDMEDLFFVIQLYSYPGNYMSEKLSVERLAETLDKLEEDLLQTDTPSARGARRVVVRFGEPIVLPRERQPREAAVTLTRDLESNVQTLLDDLNKIAKKEQVFAAS